ncbi:MAG: hypothetical protein HY519_01205 [Candidatus Aenigmarchaeota archaeon]|nr:hypothetical protein [Candidatus Aenigmarchaeota archaeon]
MTPLSARGRYAVLTAIAVLFSGCIGPDGSQIAIGPGVVIMEFSPDFSSVQSGEQVKLQIRVQNQGGVPAENTKVALVGISPSEWQSRSGGFEQALGRLSPVDRETDTPGEIQSRQFSLTAPRLPEGIEHAYEPIARVSYDYKAKAVKAISVVSTEELRRLLQQGRAPPITDVQSSGGPLSVEVRTGNAIKTGQSGRDTVSFFVKITNNFWEQGGTVLPSGVSGGGATIDYPVNVKITASGISISDCGGFANADQTPGNGIVDLWQGKDAEITCELAVSGSTVSRQESLITIELNYRYQTEAPSQVTVIGTDR